VHVVFEYVHLAQAEEHAGYLHSAGLAALIVLNGPERKGGSQSQREDG
jgi:hypothetical protein